MLLQNPDSLSGFFCFPSLCFYYFLFLYSHFFFWIICSYFYKIGNLKHHHKKLLFKGARHRRHHRSGRGHSEVDEAGSVSTLTDENYEDHLKRDRNHRHHGHRRLHHHLRHRGHDRGAPGKYTVVGDRSGIDEPPPYDEIGKEAGAFEDVSGEEEIEEAVGVDIVDPDKSKKHHKHGRFSRRHRRHHYGEDSYAGKIERGVNHLI